MQRGSWSFVVLTKSARKWVVRRLPPVPDSQAMHEMRALISRQISVLISIFIFFCWLLFKENLRSSRTFSIALRNELLLTCFFSCCLFSFSCAFANLHFSRLLCARLRPYSSICFSVRFDLVQSSEIRLYSTPDDDFLFHIDYEKLWPSRSQGA